jgi:hypothetical protein
MDWYESERALTHPILAAARAQGERAGAYSRTDDWLRAHHPDQLGRKNHALSQHGVTKRPDTALAEDHRV